MKGPWDNKSDEQNFLEPELRPGHIKKIKNIEKKGKFTSYKNLSSLKKEIEKKV